MPARYGAPARLIAGLLQQPGGHPCCSPKQPLSQGQPTAAKHTDTQDDAHAEGVGAGIEGKENSDELREA